MKMSAYLLFGLLFLISCNPFSKKIIGNGNIITESRTTAVSPKIEAVGSFNIKLIKGNEPSISIKTDENLLPYLITESEGDKLKIHVKENYSLNPSSKIEVSITTPELKELDIAGSCNVKGEGKFSGTDDLDIELSGTGNIQLAVNYREVDSEISGAGDIELSGETRDSKIRIAGVGNYAAKDLKSENVKIEIAGSGNANVFASQTLEVEIAGTGNVNYSGNPQIKQSIAGSGKIKKID